MASFPNTLKQTSETDCKASGLYAKTAAGNVEFTPVLVDGSGNLNVNVQSGGTAGAQYNDGDSFTSSTKGTLALGTDGTNVQAVATDSDGHLQIDVLTGGGGGQQYSDGASFTTASIGTLALGTDGTNVQVLNCQTNGVLNVSITNATLTIANTVSTVSITKKSPATSAGTMTLTLGTVVVATANVATKVYAYSLTTTTATAGLELAFMSGTTRLWQVILQNASGSSAGANLAVSPVDGAFLFSTGLTNTTLSLSCGSATAVHYSVAYFQE